jgi:hypothetical protein
MARKNVHTVYDRERGMWETKVEKQEKPVASSHTKDAAMEKSVKLAKELEVEHVIHNKDGKISDKDSYGKDPNPPKDQKH